MITFVKKSMDLDTRIKDIGINKNINSYIKILFNTCDWKFRFTAINMVNQVLSLINNRFFIFFKWFKLHEKQRERFNRRLYVAGYCVKYGKKSNLRKIPFTSLLVDIFKLNYELFIYNSKKTYCWVLHEQIDLLIP